MCCVMLCFQAMDASAEAVQTATQHKGTVMPISKAAPTLEKVALTADMKVSGGGKRGTGGKRNTERGGGAQACVVGTGESPTPC
jgi:hypothetical protein